MPVPTECILLHEWFRCIGKCLFDQFQVLEQIRNDDFGKEKAKSKATCSHRLSLICVKKGDTGR